MTAPAILVDKVYVGSEMIAKRLGCSKETVQRLHKAKQLRCWKLSDAPNSPLRCRRSEIDRFINQREAQG